MLHKLNFYDKVNFEFIQLLTMEHLLVKECVSGFHASRSVTFTLKRGVAITNGELDALSLEGLVSKSRKIGTIDRISKLLKNMQMQVKIQKY